MTPRLRQVLTAVLAALLGVPLAAVLVAGPALAAGPNGQVAASIIGQVERFFLNDPGDPSSGGSMVIGGQLIALPRNLLLDLPANRMGLTQLFAQAPPECVSLKESGLSKADFCNHTGSGAQVTVTANRTRGGNVIAGDVFVQKAVEVVNGVVTFIDHQQGWFRLNGNPGDPATGVMVRLDDPTGRHTVQSGLGCAAARPNCSADPRFGLDPDNYTNVFSTGYPLCLPSTVPRTFTDVLDLNGNGDATETLTTQSDAAGKGDLLCPDTNRSALVDPLLGQVSDDSRRFAPVQLGDSVFASGNFEDIGGVRFLSAHTTKVSLALTTRSASKADQPDYVILNEMFIDAPGFFRERARDQFIGATTAADSDVVISTVHRDPATGAAHEFPLGTVVGCEAAAGTQVCRRVLGPNTFRVRHDVDFAVGAVPSLNPCQQLNADPRFSAQGFCPDGNNSIADMFGMMSPVPREVQLRTGVEIADLGRAVPLLKTIDVKGGAATHGQYLFPMGVGLGGIELPAFAEINPNLLNNPANLSGLPWTLDRRLSPTGCPTGTCEATPQPLDPFPFEGIDPRQPGGLTPQGTYFDPHYTDSALSNERNRMLSFVDPVVNNFNGDKSILTWPPTDPPAVPITPTPPLNGTNTAPTARDDTATVANSTAAAPTSTNVDVLANDTPGATPFAPASMTVGAAPAHGTTTVDAVSGVVTYAPARDFAGTDTFTYTVRNTGGMMSNAARVTVTVSPPPAPAPTVTGVSPASGTVGSPVTITGTNLTAVTALRFGTVAQPAFTATSPTQITTTVPPGATTGTVSVTSTGGTATSTTAFTVVPVAPTITAVTPASGSVGDTVTIDGTNLDGATAVTFGQVTQPVVTTVSPSRITAVVPVGAPPGPLQVAVTTPGGTGTAPTPFTVNPPPATLHQITAVTPGIGPVGTLVQIDGQGFGGLSKVEFAGPGGKPVPGVISTGTGTTFFTAVPNGAVTGRITVTIGAGANALVIASPQDFVVTAPAGGGGGTGGGGVPPAAPAAPAAPVVGTAGPANGAATLSWTPAADGGSPITGYVVQAQRVSTGAVVATASAPAGATGATVRGLTNGVAYRLQVQAVNTVGAGPFSAASNPVKPADVPGAPIVWFAADGSTTDAVVSATARWLSPLRNGGAPVTQYVVTAIGADGTRTTVTVPGSARSATVKGLVKGMRYRFQIQAVNVVGTGPASRQSNSVRAR